MEKKKIAEFFSRCAATWDENQDTDEAVILTILQSGGITQDTCVLDVACGTGILFPFYKKLGVTNLAGIDISEGMTEIAKSKFPEAMIICGDAETYTFKRQFDAVMIYNAFPHFPSPGLLFENLSAALSEGGRLTVAHGASREEIQKCHEGKAKAVSLDLPTAEELSLIMGKHLNVDTVISNDKMYLVSGTKK